MEEARGEKNILSVPRSRSRLIWPFSRVSRISSSLTRMEPLEGFANSAICRERQASTAGGNVV